MARERKKSVLWRLLIIGISVYMIATLVGLWSTLNDSRAELRELEAQLSVQQTDIDELKSLLESDSHDELVERAARERLGYVYSDEQIFIDISGK
ncbi:MAG: septum formation initiator family protein [Ruminococcaceae bacterium]|nr:septum formation initiator family protein [Oscillospiraceae bacterium]